MVQTVGGQKPLSAATVDALKVWDAVSATQVPKKSVASVPTIRWPDDD